MATMKGFFLFELKLYLALGLFSKLLESTSEEPYNSRREVFVVVVVEGLGPQCSDPLCVFRFISPDLFFLLHSSRAGFVLSLVC